LMLPENGQFGRIDVAAWRQTGKIMLEQGVIDLPVAIEKALLTDGLKPCYGRKKDQIGTR
ncbi:MAG: hypothetical protein L6365_10940, partial [Desulfobulbaceae bacterium]|nr:hypothetical protein [Desulfobulbaceae bacterium]